VARTSIPLGALLHPCANLDVASQILAALQRGHDFVTRFLAEWVEKVL